MSGAGRGWPRPTPGRHPLNPARPDPLGEQLVADQLAAQPEIVAAIATTCTDDQLETALTVLSRAQSRHPALADAVTALISVDLERLLPAGITVARRLADPEPFVRALARALADANLTPQFATALAERLPTAGADLGPLKAVAHRQHARAMTEPINQYAKTLDIPKPPVPADRGQDDRPPARPRIRTARSRIGPQTQNP